MSDEKSLKKNIVVGLHPKAYENVFSERIWYTQALDEIDTNNKLQFIIFYTVVENDIGNIERKVIGCFAFPTYNGNAVREPLDNKFIATQDGNYAAFRADEEFTLKFAVQSKLPFLTSKSGEKIWYIDDDEVLKILQDAQEKHLLSDQSDAQEILNILELLIDELEGSKSTVSFPAELKKELRLIPDWLKEELDSCKVAELPSNQDFVKRLLSRSVKNPSYNLQAAALQIKLGDYKFLLSLANYCYSKGFYAYDNGDYSEASKCYLVAADLYQRDPMITKTGWKIQRRLECLYRFIGAHVQEVLAANSFEISSDIVFEKVSPKISEVRKYLPSQDVKKQILVSYYSSMGWHYFRNKNNKFTNFIKEIKKDLWDDLPPELIITYYDQLANKYSKKGDTCRDDFLQAASYKERAKNIYEKLYDERQNDTARIGFLERSVDYYKYSAYAASCENDEKDYIKYIDEAIKYAITVNNEYPTTFREENIHYLTGTKYGELTRYTDENYKKSEYHALAMDEFNSINSYESHKRFLFHQLWNYYYQLRSILGSKDKDFEEAYYLSIKALEDEWAQQNASKYLPNYTLTVHKVLHLSITTFGKDVSEDDLDRFNGTILILKARGIKPAILKIANLVYGIQLIRSCGINDPRIIGETTKTIQSAIRQLLESNTISADEIIDDLIIEKERLLEEENEQELISKLRRRKIEEDFTVEVKERVYNRSSGESTASIYETVISFLNSSQGGTIFVGVKDDTFEIVGIDTDLNKYNNSREKLKQAVLSQIHDHIPRTFHQFLPGISITYPVVDKQTLLMIKVPPGTYDLGLYIDTNGTAYIRKDGRLQRITDPIEKDQLALQKKEGRGIWASLS